MDEAIIVEVFVVNLTENSSVVTKNTHRPWEYLYVEKLETKSFLLSV